MNWLARLKKSEYTPAPALQNLQNLNEGGFVGFVGNPLGGIQKTPRDLAAANDPALPEPDQDQDPDRWCWPASDAMNSGEIDTFTARLARFTDKGLSLDDGEALADKLVTRDRDSDDRRLCLECLHLRSGAGLSGCNQWRRAGLGAAGVPADLVRQLQRCKSFTKATP